jgi:hypothetical protein
MLLVICAVTPAAFGGVQNYTDDDRQLWFDGVDQLGDYDTITFAELPVGTVVTNQYQSDLGVVFSGGVTDFGPSIYPNDSHGFFAVPLTEIRFDTPQNWFAVDHPDTMMIELYRHDALFYTSSPSGIHGVGDFNGIISDISFDAVRIFDPTDSLVGVDDMYFGVIPAPGTICFILGLALSRASKRRRPDTQ